ncbi:uncharacterized protein N7515_010331 [Penicillium bovifimosum]|uniref:Threonylcarbamoyl-AMP synthase n=1 Tax=Penicillium bovifimosum TaxID=126998 RepID=A0A9W9GIB5_9EURO|nr:uncharacterized protein N7515_010331 [Penicillium bovifimosum]KAJ5120943.1 hypothetical protein N7515_010331 [Penicillium bovifimosum]
MSSPRTPKPKEDAQAVFQVLKAGGIAILPMNVGYGIVAIDPDALKRIVNVKQRQSQKRNGMIGSYSLHQEIHVLPPQQAGIVKLLTVDLSIPLGVIAPYRPDHPIIRKLPPDVLAQSVVEDTLAMLISGNTLVEELSRLAAIEELPLLGSSANLTGKGAKGVVEDIEPEVFKAADIVVDYGRQKFQFPRASSTMVDFRTMRIVRYGACCDVVRDVLRRFCNINVPDDPTTLVP